MVTQLLRAITIDVLQATQSNASLDSSYPEPLRKYAETSREDQRSSDLLPILEVLGSSNSIMSEAWRLTQAKNRYFEAILDSLKFVQNYSSNKTHLGRTLASFREAGGNYDRIFTRELQSLLLIARSEESPIIQTAAPSELDTSNLPGIPEVTVQRSLLGGVRMFHKGMLNDKSWRARLTKILSVVS